MFSLLKKKKKLSHKKTFDLKYLRNFNHDYYNVKYNYI